MLLSTGKTKQIWGGKFISSSEVSGCPTVKKIVEREYHNSK
jgi:hypothetical protein